MVCAILWSIAKWIPAKLCCVSYCYVCTKHCTFFAIDFIRRAIRDTPGVSVALAYLC